MIVVLRLLGLAVAAALAVCLALWLVTGDRTWLRRAGRIFRYAVFALALVLVLFAGEALFHAG